MADDPQAVEGGTPSTPVVEHPPTPDAPTAPPDPFEALDDDALGRHAKEHPRLKAVIDRETRTLLKQMEGRIDAERSRREAQEQQSRDARELWEKVQQGRQGDWDSKEFVFNQFADLVDRNRLREEVIADPTTRAAMGAAFVDEIITSAAWQKIGPHQRNAILGQPTPDAFLTAFGAALTADTIEKSDHESIARAEYQRGLDEGRGIRPGPDTNAGAAVTGRANGGTTEEQIRAVLGRVRERGGGMRLAESELLEALNAQLSTRA